MEEFDDLPAPKLRLLKRRIAQKSDPAAYDYSANRANPVRSIPKPRPDYHSELEASRDQESSIPQRSFPAARAHSASRTNPVRNTPKSKPEWNSEFEASRDEESSIPQRSLPAARDHSSSRTNPARNTAKARPEWNSEVEASRDEESSVPQRSLPAAREHSASRTNPVRKARPEQTKALPEWNTDSTVTPDAEEGNNEFRHSQPQNGRPSGPRSVSSTSPASSATGSEINRVGVSRVQRQQPPVAKAVSGSRLLKQLPVLVDDASLIDSVPIKWPPSCHHVAELLNGVGCATIGEFRCFVKGIPLVKIVDAVVTADASCASPGGIRDSKDAQKCIEELIRLARNDAPIAVPKPPVAKAVMAEPIKPSAAARRDGVAPGLGTDVSALASGEIPFGQGGCPRCGRDVAGRALVMHLKTCAADGSQPKRSDPFESDFPDQRSNRTSPLAAPPAKQASSQMATMASDLPSEYALPPGVPVDALASAEEPQLPCPHCGRTFREKVLERHVGKCLKINKERKQFNAIANALPDEAIKVHKEISKQEAKQKTKAKKDDDRPINAAQMPNWKAKSEAFRNALKDARAVDQCIKEGKPLSQLPPSKPADPDLDDRIQCKHCGRRFGQQQAERHIPICPKGRGKGKR